MPVVRRLVSKSASSTSPAKRLDTHNTRQSHLAFTWKSLGRHTDALTLMNPNPNILQTSVVASEPPRDSLFQPPLSVDPDDPTAISYVGSDVNRASEMSPRTTISCSTFRSQVRLTDPEPPDLVRLDSLHISGGDAMNESTPLAQNPTLPQTDEDVDMDSSGDRSENELGTHSSPEASGHGDDEDDGVDTMSYPRTGLSHSDMQEGFGEVYYVRGNLDQQMITPSFQYEPLTEGGWVRLLRVRLGHNESTVRELRHFHLQSEICPMFVAVSYVREPTIRSKVMRLGGSDFPVPPTIFSFLEEICRDKSNTWCWIDSVCIDSGDLKESSPQISLMKDIFKRSANTIVWLSCGSSETNQAMDFLNTLAIRRSTLDRPSNLALDDPDAWKSLESVLNHPWWQKVWTIQEFLFPHKLEFQYGNKSITRAEICSALYAIRR